ncbi:MAG TPA: GntR family transcriptional regulator [Actinomycetota bacterium]
MGAKAKTILGRDTTAKVVAGMLRDEIQEGGLAPGTRLRQNEVAERFGVSTTPVREAFAQLQAEGLVRIDPHRGAVVFHPTAEDLLEYYEIREVLESLAVSHAIDRLTPAISKDLNDLIERMRRTTDARRWLRLNDEFHLKLYECANRPHLRGLIDNLRDASTPYIYMFVANRKPSDQANGEHQEILDACMRGDAKAAQRAIRDHLRHASRELAEQLTQRDAGAGETGDAE